MEHINKNVSLSPQCERTFTCVYSLMFAQVINPSERLVADVALVGFVTCVVPHVQLQRLSVAVSFRAGWALDAPVRRPARKIRDL